MFGQIKAISKSGRYLLMERLDNLDQSDKKNTPTLPEWLKDIWLNNFGKNRAGEIKIRDYANVSLEEVLENAPRIRRAWQ
jgi:hypothetical protein